jgi:hypothetical protein
MDYQNQRNNYPAKIRRAQNQFPIPNDSNKDNDITATTQKEPHEPVIAKEKAK